MRTIPTHSLALLTVVLSVIVIMTVFFSPAAAAEIAIHTC